MFISPICIMQLDYAYSVPGFGYRFPFLRQLASQLPSSTPQEVLDRCIIPDTLAKGVDKFADLHQDQVG